MIEFKKIKWRNFLSYGNNWTEFNFSQGINFISGASGSGKSCINDLLNFSLFGKPYRKININNLINSINKKNLLVYLEFSKNGKEYVIKRGLKPNIFEIYENGNLIDIDAHKTKYQEFLEENILEFDENYFNQIIIKSLTKKNSIFNYTKEEKRRLIDELFGLQEITEIKNKSKELLLRFKSDLKLEENNLSNLKQLIYQEEENVKKLLELEKKLKEEKESKIQEINNEIDKIKDEIEKIEETLQSYQELKNNFNELKNVYKEILNEIKIKEEEILKLELEFKSSKELYDKFYPVCGDCPKLKIITNMNSISKEELDKLIESKRELENKKNELKEKLQEIKSFFSNEKILINKKQLLEKQIQKLEKEKKKIENQKIEITKDNKLKQLKQKYKDKKKELEDIKNKIKKYQIIQEIFSDTGIRKYIVKKYIKIINEFMNEFLEKFELDIKFEIDENFDEIIHSRFHKNFKYENFSEGEKKRIDLSLLFAILKFNSIRKGNKANILILDEIVAGLDNVSENNFYYILKTSDFLKDKCIYIISHSKGIDSTIFDKIYEVKKEKKFSKIYQV
jgi:DNA repair exonuclease SbcCD ATPase subunit